MLGICVLLSIYPCLDLSVANRIALSSPIIAAPLLSTSFCMLTTSFLPPLLLLLFPRSSMNFPLSYQCLISNLFPYFFVFLPLITLLDSFFLNLPLLRRSLLVPIWLHAIPTTPCWHQKQTCCWRWSGRWSYPLSYSSWSFAILDFHSSWYCV